MTLYDIDGNEFIVEEEVLEEVVYEYPKDEVETSSNSKKDKKKKKKKMMKNISFDSIILWCIKQWKSICIPFIIIITIVLFLPKDIYILPEISGRSYTITCKYWIIMTTVSFTARGDRFYNIGPWSCSREKDIKIIKKYIERNPGKIPNVVYDNL